MDIELLDADGNVVTVVETDNAVSECEHFSRMIPEIVAWRERLVPRTLAEAKTEAWARIKTARDAAEQGGFAYLGKTIDSDARASLRITAAVNAAQAAGEGFAVDWTCADNTVLSLTASEMVGMGVALAAWGNACHAKARGYRAQIEAVVDGLTQQVVDDVSGEASIVALTEAELVAMVDAIIWEVG